MVSDLEDLLEEWCGWIFQQGDDPNAGLDSSGGVTMALNKNNPVWFLSGVWNKKDISRTIIIPPNTPVFIIVASSHITKQEFEKLTKEAKSDPVEDDYNDQITRISALWDSVKLRIDGEDYSKPQLKLIRTKLCWMYINPNPKSPYIQQTGIAGGLQPMKTEAYVVKLDTLGEPGTAHTIKLEAHANADNVIGVSSYDVGVTYNILVGGEGSQQYPYPSLTPAALKRELIAETPFNKG